MTSHAFTDEDRAFLIEHYPSKGSEWCAKMLKNHTPSSCRTKANKMGLKLNDEQMRLARHLGSKKAAANAAKNRIHGHSRPAPEPEAHDLPIEYLQAPSIWRVAQRFASDGAWQT